MCLIPGFLKPKSRFGHKRVHLLRAQFLIESIKALRDSWREMGSDLIVRVGHPEHVIFDLAKEFKTSMVFCNRERTRDEVTVQDSLEQNLWTIGQEMRFTRGKMLYYTQDLPFPVTHTPDNFTAFRKELERIVPIRAELPMPDSISPIIQPF
jgi:deoxyribodipyrimidine photo-lyase